MEAEEGATARHPQYPTTNGVQLSGSGPGEAVAHDADRRTDSDDGASSSDSSTGSDIRERLRRRVFPPVLGPAQPFAISQPRPLQTRTSTPSRSAGPFVPPPHRHNDGPERRPTPGPRGHGGGDLPASGPAPSKPFRPAAFQPGNQSDGSESSYEEVTSIQSYGSRNTGNGRNGKAGFRNDTTTVYTDTGQSFELRNYDEHSESSPEGSDADSLELDYRNLEEKRDEVAALRESLISARHRLRESREVKDAADNAFMALVRPLLLKGRLDPLSLSADLIEGRFGNLQSTRTDYQSLEASYEDLEDQLSKAELELDQLERQFISKLYYPVRPVERGPTEEMPDEEDVPPSRTSLLGIPAHRSDDRHPLYNNFMSAIADLQLAKEHLEDLTLRKQAIEEEKANLLLIEKHHPKEIARNVKHISDADLEFLRDYPDEENQAREEVDKLELEVDHLKQVCREADVIPAHAPFHEVYTIEPEAAGDDMSIDVDPEEDPTATGGSFPSRYKILLADPGHLLQDSPLTAKAALRKAVKLPNDDPDKKKAVDLAAREMGIENLIVDSETGNKADMINRWLLQRLRTSAFEVQLLYSTFVSFMKILDLDRWQRDVLYHWPRDEKAKMPKELFEGPVTSVEVDVPTKTSEPEAQPDADVESPDPGG